MTLEFVVAEQTVLPLPSASIPRKGSRNYLKLNILFEENWDDYTTVLLWFESNGHSDFVTVKNNEEIDVPEYFTDQDYFQIYLEGTNGAESVQTNILTITLDPSGAKWFVPPPEFGETGILQIANTAHEAKKIADDAKICADAAMETAEDATALAHDAKIPIVKGSSADGVTYSVSGNLPDLASGSFETHCGKGQQIIFVPVKTNATSDVTIKVNDGEAIGVRMRAAYNQSNNDQSPEATIAVPAGALMRGVPYTMTYCGKYWLVDSYIPLLACANDEYQAELMREFAVKAMRILESDMIAVPVINSTNALPGRTQVGIASIVLGENEAVDPDGFIKIPAVGYLLEHAVGGTKIPIVSEIPADMSDGDIAILEIADDELEDDELEDDEPVTKQEMQAYVSQELANFTPTESDPTVPEWAKQPTKPSYSVAEVGALPNTTPIPVVPDALPNPFALTFTGAAEGSYDGSKAVTVNIPQGGGSTDEWEYIGEFNSGDKDLDTWIVDKYADGTPISLKEMYFEYDFKASASTTANTKVLLGNPASESPFRTNCAYASKDMITTSGKQSKAGDGHYVTYVPCGDTHFYTVCLIQSSNYTPTWNIGRSSQGGTVLRQCVGGIAFQSANASTGLIGANSTVKIWGVKL